MFERKVTLANKGQKKNRLETDDEEIVSEPTSLVTEFQRTLASHKQSLLGCKMTKCSKGSAAERGGDLMQEPAARHRSRTRVSTHFFEIGCLPPYFLEIRHSRALKFSVFQIQNFLRLPILVLFWLSDLKKSGL